MLRREEGCSQIVFRSIGRWCAIGVAVEDIWLISVTSRRHRLRRLRPRRRLVPNTKLGVRRSDGPAVLAGQSSLAGECSQSERVDNVVDTPVVGRLPRCLPFWRDTLKANQFVLDIIEHGYTIPFVEEPLPAYAANNRSALSHPVFVREAIDKLISSNVVREVDSPAYSCNPLTVVAGKKKLRLVLDLSRFVNPYVRYVHFKYEDWSVAEQVVQPGSWFFNWDFTSGYHHVAINPVQYKYLGFAFNWPGKGMRLF